LKAAAGAEANDACFDLFEKVIDPTLKSFSVKNSGSGQFSKGGKSTDEMDMEDILGETRLRLIGRLYDFKTGSDAAEIESLKAYIFTTARSIHAEILRERYPNRASLSGKLRYLLEGATNQRGFALWTYQGELVAGFRAWEGRPSENGHRFQTLLAHPNDFQGKALAKLGSGHPLAEMMAAAFNWIGAPIRFHALVSILAVWTDTHDKVERLDGAGEDDFEFKLPDPGAGPDEQLIWLECLAILWKSILECTLKWRIAFLLKSHVTHEFVHYRTTSRSGLAKALEMAPEILDSLWMEIPLDDLAIAQRLKLARQQVINLRSITRRALNEKVRSILFENISEDSR
jgi:DNA-directed RNA polymerase specialized sigma24 family protein